MILKNTKDRYGAVSQCLHWLIALLVIVMLCVGFFLEDMPSAYKGTAYMLHKSTGLLIFALIVVKLLWRFVSPSPDYARGLPRWQQILSTAMHHSLTLLLIVMPLSGFMMSVASNRLPSFYGLFTVTLPGIPQSKALAMCMNASHQFIAWVLIGFVSLHVLGALYHLLIKRDQVMRRMLP